MWRLRGEGLPAEGDIDTFEESWSLAPDTRPTWSERMVRSIEMICVTLATESFGRPVWRRVSRTFPGAADQRRLLVKVTLLVGFEARITSKSVRYK